MKFNYPVTDFDSLEKFFDFAKLRKGGFYPISVSNGVSNAWHGGIHIEGSGKAIRAIADGEIIACRIPQKPIEEEYEKGKKALSSNGFVLIRHKYEYTAKDDSMKKFVFYSLYNHLMPYRSNDNKIFGGNDVPNFLRKEIDGYEVVGNVTLRKSEKTNKAASSGDEIEVLKVGHLLKKETTAEAPDHWINSKANEKLLFKKVSSVSNKKIGFISTDSKYVKERKVPIIEYDSDKFPFDAVKNCTIAVKSDDVIGYTGPCGEVKNSGYTACHFEVFTINEQELKDFLAGNVKNEEKQRRFFRFENERNLQKNYPVKIKGSWDVKLLEKGTNFSKIEIKQKKKTAHRDNDLTDYNATAKTYSIKSDAFGRINSLFDGILKNTDKLKLIEEVKDTAGKSTKDRIVAFDYKEKPNTFWIPNANIAAEKKKGDVFELTEGKFTKLYESDKEPDNVREIKISLGTVLNGHLKELKVGADTWYQLEFDKQKGWIKDGTAGFKKISAYKWKEWGFTDPPIKDDPYDFLFDGNEKGKFMKEIVAKIDTDNNKKITTEELQAAIKNKAIASQLAGIVNYHRTDWLGASTADCYLDKASKIADKIINNIPGITEKGKDYLNKKKKELLDYLKGTILTAGFWKDVNEVKNNSEVFYFHPIAFVEQMKRMTEKFDYLSKYLTYKQAIYSNTAVSKGIDNSATDEHIENLRYLGTEIYDKIYEHFNGKVQITNMYRSTKLNANIAGASENSQHMKGEAMDIAAISPKTNKEIFKYVIDNLVFDQIVWEHGDENNPAWVHVSYKKGNNRYDKKRATGTRAKPVYSTFNIKL